SGRGQLHVAPTGRSGDGSPGNPFGTLEAGLRAVGPGQTMVVHGGEYRERINLGSQLAVGRSDARITVTAAGGERPVVRGLLRLRGLRYWTIEGINVTWDAERNARNEHMVVFTDGSNWVYRNSEVWGARSYAGVLVGGDPVGWALRGLHIHDTHPSNDTNQDHLIYCNCGRGGGVIERNLLVGSTNGRAIKVGTVHDHNTSISNVTIRYNTMIDNTGPSNIQLSYRVSNVTIERNLLVGVKAGRANITTYRLAGTGNVARNNLGWRSDGVVQSDPGLIDGGGNTHSDPRLQSGYRPGAAAAKGYGHLAN
ncbi:MAG: hypothetical protein ACR2QK_07115, partial [Acidimicrobiales bacterium]